jgi:hypothetical protein
MGLVPRVAEMLYQRYQSAVDQRVFQGTDPESAEAEARAELREQVLGGRIVTAFCGTAPLAAEMRGFVESCLDVHVLDGYGLTEVGMVTKDGRIAAPPVLGYKLIDVPEPGYFLTYKPFPRCHPSGQTWCGQRYSASIGGLDRQVCFRSAVARPGIAATRLAGHALLDRGVLLAPDIDGHARVDRIAGRAVEFEID